MRRVTHAARPLCNPGPRGDAIHPPIKPLAVVATLAALVALTPPAAARGKGLFDAIFAGCMFSSTRVSTGVTSWAAFKGSSDSSSDSDKPPVEAARADQRRYLADNYYAVTRDAAAGGGEHLAAMARLMGCIYGVRARLFARAKAQHHRIFVFRRGDGREDIDATLTALRRVLAEDPELHKRCRFLQRPPRQRAPQPRRAA